MASTAFAHELILGRYRPVRPLGSGGMGHVWLARDERTGLDIALKMVGREGNGAQRAEREARAAAALRHPRCQRIHALARDSSHVYIAYEYIPGRTMRQAIAAGAIGDHDAIEIAAQVLEALDHAHGRGIVHRDVKPSNVLLHESSAIDVRLLDFGLAQMEEFETLTAMGDVPGTLGYVSPERLAGLAGTAAADVWAVGVMLWETLTGVHPFRDETTEATTRRIQAGAPPIEGLRPDLPPRLRALIASALELNPARRPSAADLSEALRAPLHKRTRRAVSPEAAPTRRAVPAVASLAHAADRFAPAAAAALWTAWASETLPFYPSGWPLGLTALNVVLGLAAPRVALPFALAVTVFPLANISIGLAVLFAVVGALWVAVSWRDPRGAIVAVAGPLLWPISALALLPLIAQLARSPLRRAVQTASALSLAACVAAIDRRPLPFGDGHAVSGVALAGVKDPVRVAGMLAHVLATHAALAAEVGVLSLAAVALPYARGRGPALAALAGAVLVAATVLVAPQASMIPFFLAGALTVAVLIAVPSAGRRD